MADKQPLTSNDFGEGEFGPRLEYSKPKYRDPIFGILYYIHLAAVFGGALYLWITQYPDVNNGDSSGSSISDVPLTGIFVGIGACMLSGILFGLFWLTIMKRFAATIIKAMLFLNIAVWVAVALVGVVVGELALIVIGIIFALIYGLWTWCIWRRIPFASALLSVASNITSQYGGTVFLSLLVILFNVIWILLWGSATSGYLIVQPEPSNLVIFLLLISFYWGFQVNQNVSHTTTCGVTATWFFATEINYNPTPPAFKRTMTTSFGSVCLGSFIVAFLQALRAMIRSAQNNKNAFITCIALCLLNCIESLIRYFNKYAYAFCAIYGTSFMQSAKRTWSLFMSRGMSAIINDDLTGLAIFAGALIGGVVSAGVGYLIGYIFYNDNNDDDIRQGVPIGLAVYGFFIGLVFCQCVLYVIHSSVIALFVCYAEDPATLANNRPEEYNMIVNAKPDFGRIRNEYGGNNRQQQQQNYETVVVPNSQPPQAYNDGNMYGNNQSGNYKV